MMELKSISGSGAEDLFIDLFAETFGAEKAGYLYSQYPFFDIYQNARFADFVCESGAKRIAIEIDDEGSHNPRLVSKDKFTDDLLKQNSMIHLGWDVYRWTVRQMQKQPDTVKDELRLFLGSESRFKEIDDYLPPQRGQALDGGKLELREYQQEALNNLQTMRESKETIALLYQATGTGKTVTAVMDAKRVGGRTLFVAHTVELVNQAYNTFKSIWNSISVGKFADSVKERDAHVICGSIQSVALNLDLFKDDDFDYIIIDEAHHATADTYQKVLAYFKPKFILGLTATPERADDTNILEIFKNTAHKLDIQTAVEMGALTNVRCIRIHTNIDMTKVRFNSVQYNIRDLDVKICVTERNKLIVDTWINYVNGNKIALNAGFAKAFGYNLLKAKFFLDNYIVHHSNEDDTLENNPWKLQYWHREGNRGKTYSKNLCEDDEIQDTLVQLLSLFEVSFTARQRKNYLFYCLLYLFKNANRESTFKQKYRDFLEGLADKYFKGVYLEQSCLNEINTPQPGSFDEKLLKNGDVNISIDNENTVEIFDHIYGDGTEKSKGIPLFIFNYLDYRLWKAYLSVRGSKEGSKERQELFNKFGCNDFGFDIFKQFYFSRTRRSLEHFFPQADIDKPPVNLSVDQINCFGNYGMIGADANSSGSNYAPKVKLEHYLDTLSGKVKLVSVASLKFMIMMQTCKDNIGKRESCAEWNREDMVTHQKKMKEFLK